VPVARLGSGEELKTAMGGNRFLALEEEEAEEEEEERQERHAVEFDRPARGCADAGNGSVAPSATASPWSPPAEDSVITTKQCASCELTIAKSGYSKRQWGEGNNSRRCRDCIEGGGAGAGTGRDPNMRHHTRGAAYGRALGKGAQIPQLRQHFALFRLATRSPKECTETWKPLKVLNFGPLPASQQPRIGLPALS